MYLTNFFDENPVAVIRDAVENLTKSFEGLQIKKSQVAEFMKEEFNISIKVVTRHPVARNSESTFEVCAEFVEKWITQKDTFNMLNCVFLYEPDFDINMSRSKA